MGDRPSEKLIFDRFRQRYGLIGEFRHNTGTNSDDQDKPDFTGPHQGQILGIEITEIGVPEKTHGQTLRQHEAAKRRIVTDAREKAVQAKLPALLVRVIFQGDLRKGTVASLTEILFQIVKSRCPEPNAGEVELDGESGLPTELWKVYIHNYGDREHDWDYIEVGGVETEFSRQVQDIVAAKSGELPRYLKHCQTCWLIIAALCDRPSSFYLPNNQVRRTRYRSGFEKVFFVNVALEIVAELSVVGGT